MKLITRLGTLVFLDPLRKVTFLPLHRVHTPRQHTPKCAVGLVSKQLRPSAPPSPLFSACPTTA